jgi:homoserine dehydrogenase
MPSQGKVTVSEKEQMAVDANGRFPLRVALFGFGTVGSSVARILLESKPEGVEITHVYNRNVSRKKAD